MLSLNMVGYLLFSPLLSTWIFLTGRGGNSKTLLVFEFVYQRPPSCLKVRGGVVVAHEILETAQSPKSPFPSLIWGWDLVLGLVLELVNYKGCNCSCSYGTHCSWDYHFRKKMK